MTQEEKQLLLKDLCGRLPYGVKILYTGWDNDRCFEYQVVEKLIGVDDHFIYTLWGREKNKHSIMFADFKPYLRPMSSMTEEEVFEFIQISDSVLEIGEKKSACVLSLEQMDWLNKNMFDYRGLIPMGLALEAKEGLYKTE